MKPDEPHKSQASLSVVGSTDEPQEVRISATPYEWCNPAEIDRRDWLYSNHLVRGFVSVTVAPGGVGKTSLVVAEALAMVSGKPLLEGSSQKELTVWFWNLEDPSVEITRQVQATCQKFKLVKADLGKRLHVNSGRDQSLRLSSGNEINWNTVDQLIETITQKSIDVLIVDPFVSSHSANENDNTAQNALVKAWGHIAHKAECAVHLIHHTRKSGHSSRGGEGSENSAESARGGGALIDGARSVRVLNWLTPGEAKSFGVALSRSRISAKNDKVNLTPQPKDKLWFQLENIQLANGDEVGVAARWIPESSVPRLSNEQKVEICSRVADGNYRKDVQSEDWVGKVIGEVIGIEFDDKSNRPIINGVLDHLFQEHVLVVAEWKNPKGRLVKIVKAGGPIT